MTEIRDRLSISFKVFRAIAHHALGREGYRVWVHGTKVATAKENVAVAHHMFALMTPDQRAERAKRLFGGTCALEASLSEQLVQAGVTDFVLNDWQCVSVDGRMVPREADIKIRLTDGRKVVVMCDGEAFHGPKFIFGAVEERIADDIKTARAYYVLGYSVVRYSESEIKSGWASAHLLNMLERLRASSHRIYRTWHPQVEEVV